MHRYNELLSVSADVVFRSNFLIESRDIDHMALVGALGNSVDAVICREREAKLAPFDFVEPHIHCNRESGWRRREVRDIHACAE